MKDVGEAVASVIILGIGLSITISAVASGRLFSLGSEACQEGASGDCLLLAILVVWGLQLQLWGQPMSCSGSGGTLESLGCDPSSGIVRCYFVMVRLLSTLPSSLALLVLLVVETR